MQRCKVIELINKGVDVSALDNKAILIATKMGDRGIIKLLIESGANIRNS